MRKAQVIPKLGQNSNPTLYSLVWERQIQDGPVFLGFLKALPQQRLLRTHPAAGGFIP